MSVIYIIFLLLNSAGLCIAQAVFEHTSGTDNISGNSTILLKEISIYDNPNMILIVKKPEKYQKEIGVWFDGMKWRIFNQDLSPFPAGITFEVAIQEELPHIFIHTATSANTRNGISYTDHPYTREAEWNSFDMTQNWNPGGKGGVYNNNPAELFYDQQAKTWAIRNANGAPVPLGASFNIRYLSTAIRQRPLKGVTNVPQQVVNTNPIANLNAAAGPNLGFEFGLTNWTATGNAFSNQPVTGNEVKSQRILHHMFYDKGGIGGDYWKNMLYPVGHKGDKWIGTYEYGNGDAPTGTLTSIPFTVAKRYITFLMGGGKDISNLYVELQVKKQDYENAWGVGRPSLFGATPDSFMIIGRQTPSINSEELYRYYFDLAGLLNNRHLNTQIRVKIVDNKSGGWGHINVDDFLFSDSLTEFLSFQLGGFGLLADKDKPVWGFSDLHAHWVNHVGLKGLMHGSPGGNWLSSDVRRDIPPCDEFCHRMPTFLSPGVLLASQEKEAMRRVGERMANFGNLLCTGLALSNLADLPLYVGLSTGAGIISAVNGYDMDKNPGHMMSLFIDAILYAFIANPINHVCAYPMITDILTKHYGNNTPPDRPDVSNFIDFPRWSTFMHQTMHISWVRRSYEGGQRLMVVPVGVAKSWEFVTLRSGEQPASAKLLIEQAVRELKRIVSLNPDWLGIAYTPEDARRLVLENKMAVIIGIEQAEIGNYFPTAEEEVNWLHDMGIRHVFPIHNINNKLGGCAVFNSNLNAYNDIVHRTSQDGPVVAFKVREGKSSDGTGTELKMEKYFMRQVFKDIPVAGFGNMPFIEFADVPAELGYNQFQAHKNADGLTRRGKDYMKEIMKKGMIIDVDHMSDRSQDSAMIILQQYNYPMVAGHANFRSLRRNSDETAGDKEPRLKTEFTIHDARLQEISRAGGMFGIMNQQNNIRPAANCPVPNNSAGGSPSFIQAYWHVLQKTGGQQGIAFGSDFNGFAPQTSPRFGVQAAYFLSGDDKLNVPCDSRTYNSANNRSEDKLRRCHAFQQVKGVRYDLPIKTYHYHRFLKPDFLTEEERDIWEALAIAKSGIRPTEAWQPGGGLDVQRTGLQQDKIKNIAIGFQTNRAGNYLQILNCPEYVFGGDCMAERKAAFMCKYGVSSLPVEMVDYRTQELYLIMQPIYDLWMQFENGPNEPLRRSYAYPGGRDFDFNLDGLAHYGMYPDMIQDMKNLGLQSADLRPLFVGAEQYIKIWEQSYKAGSDIVRAESVPKPYYQNKIR